MNVNQSSGCKGVTTSTTDCEVTASSFQTVPPVNRPHETCANVSYVVTTPVIIGTNLVGACAGLTLLGPTIQVNDGAAGNYTVYPRVTVTKAGWAIQGSLVAVNATTASVVILHVTGRSFRRAQ